MCDKRSKASVNLCSLIPFSDDAMTKWKGKKESEETHLEVLQARHLRGKRRDLVLLGLEDLKRDEGGKLHGQTRQGIAGHLGMDVVCMWFVCVRTDLLCCCI